MKLFHLGIIFKNISLVNLNFIMKKIALLCLAFIAIGYSSCTKESSVKPASKATLSGGSALQSLKKDTITDRSRLTLRKDTITDK
jgi:hypothetical protein